MIQVSPRESEKNVENTKHAEFTEDLSFEVLTQAGKKIAIEPQKWLKCKNCDFETISYTKWKSHTHHSQKFQCFHCNINFASQKTLKHHTKLCLNGEKSYQCSICSKSFAKSR